jgi:tetratricopeptide (TPR) repeat protein
MSRKISVFGLLSFILLLTAGWLGGSSVAVAQSVKGEIWADEGYSLEAKESFQFAVRYDEIPARRWELVVDGGGLICDLSVLRVLGEELVYYETRESRHEVSIPWGFGEEIMVVITNRDHPGAFHVSLVGPPKSEVQASYSYDVNRALENFTAGKSLQAEEDCRKALKRDPDDEVAKVLLAGFLRDKQFYGQAAELVDEALTGDLSGYMRELAENLRSELIILQAPLPEHVLRGVTRAVKFLDQGKNEEALEVCDKILEGEAELGGPSRGKFLTLKGRALEALGRNFAAVDAYSRALPYIRSKEGMAVVYFHMGSLFLQMGNPAQAQGAFTIALEYGLPSGLELQAREALQASGEQLQGDR